MPHFLHPTRKLGPPAVNVEKPTPNIYIIAVEENLHLFNLASFLEIMLKFALIITTYFSLSNVVAILSL